MLLKVSLIIAILASVATLVISHLQVAEKINTLQTDLATTQQELKTAHEAETKAQAEAKAAKQENDKNAKDLAERSAELEETRSNLKTQEARANKFEADFNKTSGELTDTQRSLAAWKALGIPVDQVQRRLVELAKAREDLLALNEEKRLMIRKINSLDSELKRYVGEKEVPPELPAGLRGKVVAVDPKWDFVILDIGEDQGVLERGELLVNRNGKLVAKVKVTSVEKKRSIANILPESKQAEVLEGDQVLY